MPVSSTTRSWRQEPSFFQSLAQSIFSMSAECKSINAYMNISSHLLTSEPCNWVSFPQLPVDLFFKTANTFEAYQIAEGSFKLFDTDSSLTKRFQHWGICSSFEQGISFWSNLLVLGFSTPPQARSFGKRPTERISEAFPHSLHSVNIMPKMYSPTQLS